MSRPRAAPAVSVWRRLPALVLALLCALSVKAESQTARKPRLPPGLDPGGVAVAIAAPVGIDYTRPEIAGRLARDGEGELIGWDFVDNDRFPYLSPDARPAPGLATDAMHVVSREARSARLVPFRTRVDTLALGRLVVFSGQGPVKVLLVLTATETREPWAAFAEAAAHFKRVLIVVPAARPGQGGQAFPAGLALDNLLSVQAFMPGAPAPPTGAAAANLPVADVAVLPAPVEAGTASPVDSADHMAAARIAALAARLVAADPKLEGPALRARILALAKPLPPPHDKATRHGWIAGPLTP